MALSLGIALPSPKLPLPCPPPRPKSSRPAPATRCESSQRPDPATAATGGGGTDLQIGSPVIVVEAPATLKTADSMPSLRLNAGLVKPGDVGRIIARKPKDVWAVRLAIGSYLLDGKHFKPLDFEE